MDNQQLLAFALILNQHNQQKMLHALTKATEVGEKLLEHFKTTATTEMMQAASFTELQNTSTNKIMQHVSTVVDEMTDASTGAAAAANQAATSAEKASEAAILATTTAETAVNTAITAVNTAQTAAGSAATAADTAVEAAEAVKKTLEDAKTTWGKADKAASAAEKAADSAADAAFSAAAAASSASAAVAAGEYMQTEGVFISCTSNAFLVCMSVLKQQKKLHPVQLVLLWISFVCILISIGMKFYLMQNFNPSQLPKKERKTSTFIGGAAVTIMLFLALLI